MRRRPGKAVLLCVTTTSQSGENETSRLLIVGASARAAAQSACRVGFIVDAADCFADDDLRQVAANCVQIPNYPHGLLEIASTIPLAPWIYTGALENEPDLIEELAKQRPLWGNSADVVRQVRDPNRLFAALKDAGFDALTWQKDAEGLATDCQWICKPIRSAGGRNVFRWRGGKLPSRSYFQQFQPGKSLGLSFVGNGQQAVFLAAAEHLPAAEWNGAKDFQYAGSVGPILLPQTIQATCQQLGDFLTEEFQLVGLFGVDVIFDGKRIWPLELNPRFTASMELIERTFDVNLVRMHQAACEHGELLDKPISGGLKLHGKAILYATTSFEVGHQFHELAREMNPARSWPALADNPALGTMIQPGMPICTIFAEGEDVAAVGQNLRQFAGQLQIVVTLLTAWPH